MPELGINDPDFSRPTTDRKSRAGRRIKLPGEYAEFRLSDGRFLGEVIGDSFFGPETRSDGGAPLSKSDRELLREGNSLLPGIKRKSPQSFAPPQTESGIFEGDRAQVSTEPRFAAARFGNILAPANEELSPEFTQDSLDADSWHPQITSDIEEAPVPEEQETPGLEQSRASGMLAPPFEMLPPLPRIQARRDSAGGWWHGASRGGGVRRHNGVDLLAEPGTPVRSPIDGTVHRINFTTTGMATITLGNDDGREVKFFYVAPVDGKSAQLLEPGSVIRAGQIIGSVEDLGEGYRDARTGRMKNHVHMRVSENGEPVDPFPWLAQWWESPEGSGKNWYPRRHSVAPGIGNTPDYDAVGEGQRWRREGEQR